MGNPKASGIRLFESDGQLTVDRQELEKVDLSGILPSATIMVVTMTATTNTGRQLSPNEWKMVLKACDMCEELTAAKQQVKFIARIMW
jgi:snoRNA binding domain, fibrillarin